MFRDQTTENYFIPTKVLCGLFVVVYKFDNTSKTVLPTILDVVVNGINHDELI